MNFYKGQKLLVIAAHPDDEVLGCGGMIAKAVANDVDVFVKFMGEGISARFPLGEYDSQEFHDQTKIRNEGANKALASLGVGGWEFGERLCTQFDSLPLLDLVKDIEAAIATFSPDTLLTHNPAEVNIDHRLTYEAVEVATRPTRENVPSEIYTFEIPCSGSWTYESTFKPNTYVDVADFWDAKLRAWACYEGESRPFPFPRSTKGLETVANYRGMQANLVLAEAFRLVRKIVK